MIFGGELSPYELGKESRRKAKRIAESEGLDMVLDFRF
tara:strand:- start:723 stop:836 length:114 start_codon:yes stop_codon:yes gene_type:complete